MFKIINAIFTIVLLCIGFGYITPVQAQSCATIPVGLVSTYSGDGNALDARSRNNGTVQGNVTYTAGHVGQAFQLGGVGDNSGNGDRVSVGNPVDLRLQEFTIEAWVKRSSTTIVTNSPNPGSPDGIFFAYGQSGYAFLIDQPTSRIGFSHVGINQVNSNLTITDTNWHHVAVTKSATQLTFYLDGVAGTPIPYTANFASNTNSAIGARGDNQVDNAFFGAIDELAIYDRPLSTVQVQAIFNAGTAGRCKPLATLAPDDQVLWLTGDGNANDTGAGGTNGVLENSAGYAPGKSGQAFKFDGLDDQMTVPHHASQNPITGLTVEAWINPVTLLHGGTILQKRSAANVGGYVLETTQPSGGGAPNGLVFHIMIGGVYRTLNPGNVLSAGAWQHVAATYDGATMRMYINGVEVASQPQTGAIDAYNDPIVIARNVVNGSLYHGLIDEIGLYRRALSSAEVQSIATADIAGKYKSQSTVPSGIAAWYSGDANTTDLAAGNNGTLNGGAGYAAGKVGRAFSFNGTTAYFQAPSTPANDPTTAATLEAWVYFNRLPSVAGHSMTVIRKSGISGTDLLDIGASTNDHLYFNFRGDYAYSLAPVQTGVWYHVVGTAAASGGIRMYLNGQFQTVAGSFSPRDASGVPLQIGGTSALPDRFEGLIDEPAIYSRALTADEVRDIYYSGTGGKYKGVGANKAAAGDVEVTFGSAANAVTIQETQLNPASLPAFPMGLTPQVVYDIDASSGSSDPSLCFNLPSFSPSHFNYLRIYHLESGVWQNRTAGVNSYSTLCSTTLSSLSPVAIVEIPTTAAEVAVSGRVTGQKGGLGNVSVTLFGGEMSYPLTTRTNAFGYYKFEGVPVGETYVISVSSKQYTFAEPALLIDLRDEISDADFYTAIPSRHESVLKK